MNVTEMALAQEKAREAHSNPSFMNPVFNRPPMQTGRFDNRSVVWDVTAEDTGAETWALPDRNARLLPAHNPELAQSDLCNVWTQKAKRPVPVKSRLGSGGDPVWARLSSGQGLGILSPLTRGGPPANNQQQRTGSSRGGRTLRQDMEDIFNAQMAASGYLHWSPGGGMLDSRTGITGRPDPNNPSGQWCNMRPTGGYRLMGAQQGPSGGASGAYGAVSLRALGGGQFPDLQQQPGHGQPSNSGQPSSSGRSSSSRQSESSRPSSSSRQPSSSRQRLIPEQQRGSGLNGFGGVGGIGGTNPHSGGGYDFVGGNSLGY